ncbi:MAG TPA: UpxY family transcription antiterminator [Bacteroidales bacterium]|nr:UpxY family transcription antiterminator [Bacteroidales bacterium]
MKWYACYTKPRAEKKTQIKLEKAGITCYLPLKTERRKWSDRLKTVSVPLFTSYVFVQIENHEFNKARIEGDIAGFIIFEGKPVPIPDDQIETIKRLVASANELEIAPEGMQPGQKIEILGGHLMGIRGELVRHQGTQKVLVKLDIGQGLIFNIDKNMIGSI